MSPHDRQEAQDGPYIVRWRTARLATIEGEEAGLVASLQFVDAGVRSLTIHDEPTSPAGRRLLSRALALAVEGYERRAGGAGARGDKDASRHDGTRGKRRWPGGGVRAR
jgi:hypothetical protein